MNRVFLEFVLKAPQGFGTEHGLKGAHESTFCFESMWGPTSVDYGWKGLVCGHGVSGVSSADYDGPGGWLAVFGLSLVWFVWDGFTGPGPAPDYYWIQIGSITLEGWKIYACAGTMLVMAVTLIALGLSLFPRRKGDEREST